MPQTFPFQKNHGKKFSWPPQMDKNGRMGTIHHLVTTWTYLRLAVELQENQKTFILIARDYL